MCCGGHSRCPCASCYSSRQAADAACCRRTCSSSRTSSFRLKPAYPTVMQVLHVVGARPNFMKLAPVHCALSARGVNQRIVHTGQHYGAVMSDGIVKELGLPEPDVNLGVGSGSHAYQTSGVMTALEERLLVERPDLILVYGD